MYIVPNDVKFKEPVYTITDFKGHYNPLGDFLEGGGRLHKLGVRVEW